MTTTLFASKSMWKPPGHYVLANAWNKQDIVQCEPFSRGHVQGHLALTPLNIGCRQVAHEQLLVVCNQLEGSEHLLVLAYVANSSSVHPPLLWVRTHQIHFGDHCREANIRDIFGENLQLCHICLRLFIGLPLQLVMFLVSSLVTVEALALKLKLLFLGNAS